MQVIQSLVIISLSGRRIAKLSVVFFPDGDQYTNEEDKGSACNLGFYHKKI